MTLFYFHIVAHPHRLGSVSEEIKQPVTQGVAETEGAQFVDKMLWDDSIVLRAEVQNNICTSVFLPSTCSKLRWTTEEMSKLVQVECDLMSFHAVSIAVIQGFSLAHEEMFWLTPTSTMHF